MTDFSADDGRGPAPPDEEAPASVKGTGTVAGCGSAEDGPDDTPSGGRSETASAVGFVGGLSDINPLATYMRRIDAVDRSMFTAVVQEYEGRYPKDIARISLDAVDGKPTGEITVKIQGGGDPAPYKPTDGEAEAIRAAARAALWPEHTPCVTILKPPPALAAVATENLFEFRDENGNIIMLQELRETKNGKAYIPWTHWSDGSWRTMEPDGLLPLYGAGKDRRGVDQLKNADVVFLHEGAKAARAMRRMVEALTPEDKKALAEHPWGRELQVGAHLGWIGGALSPHRTDWSVLAKAGIRRVYISADNDPQGVGAVPKIAKLLRSYGIEVWAIRFDDRFPRGFDLGDPFPPRMFKGGGCVPLRYVGPRFRECVSPATWATLVGSPPPTTGRGRPPSPPVHLRPEFVRQWLMVIHSGKTMFVARDDPARLYSEDEFNTLMRPFSDLPRVSDLFKKEGYDATVTALAYEPGTPHRVINIRGSRAVNRYTPSIIVAATGDHKEFARWEDYLAKLIPDEDDRWQVKRYIATLIARPDIRMRYGVLLISVMQGVGKTVLCEILGTLVGEHNYSTPSARQATESEFNGWLAYRRLIVINEIYAGGDWRAYNKLKDLIGDDTIQVNEKNIPQYQMRNWAHIMLCSNSPQALKVENVDRRLLVPTVTEEKQPAAYWVEFHDWLAGGGYGVIRQWAEWFVGQKRRLEDGSFAPQYVGPAEHAPTSKRKQQLIEDSRDPAHRSVVALAEAACARAAATGEPVVLIDREVDAWLMRDGGKGRSPRVILEWLVEGGLKAGDRLRINKMNQYAAGTLDTMKGKGWKELRSFGTKPLDLMEDDM